MEALVRSKKCVLEVGGTWPPDGTRELGQLGLAKEDPLAVVICQCDGSSGGLE